MKLFRSLSAGVMDSSLASLSTFVIGVYAARHLDPAMLGLFALHFSAFVLVTRFPHQGVFIPLEALASRSPDGLRFVGRGLSLSWVPAVICPAVLLLPMAAAPGGVPLSMGLTAAAATFLSPIQDFVRRMLHLGECSYHAVAMSVMQLATTVTALVMLHNRAPMEAVPFAALAAANLVSFPAGVAFVALILRRRPAVGDIPRPSLRELLRSGRWLMGAAASAAGATFLAATLLGRLGSIEALGMADAARVVARPVLVVTAGMTAVLGPKLMKAAAINGEGEGRRLGGVCQKAVAAFVLVYLGAFGWAHAYNPMSWFVPLAFELPLLVVVTVVADGLRGLAFPLRFEAIGGARAPDLLRVDVRSGSAQVAVALFAGWLQAFTLAVAAAAFAVVHWRGLLVLRSRIYALRPSHSPRRPVLPIAADAEVGHVS